MQTFYSSKKGQQKKKRKKKYFLILKALKTILCYFNQIKKKKKSYFQLWGEFSSGEMFSFEEFANRIYFPLLFIQTLSVLLIPRNARSRKKIKKIIELLFNNRTCGAYKDLLVYSFSFFIHRYWSDGLIKDIGICK